MESQRKLVQSHFDRLAPGYRSRYEEGGQIFLKYLYEDRLEKALAGWDTLGKTVLDIGAGTGILYDRMPQGQDYYACDISAAMLEQSAIPEERRWVGAPQECNFPVSTFDAIFALGVTTYLTGPELVEMMGFIAEKLRPGGRSVLSFTNGASFDFLLRKYIPKRWKKPFAIRAYTPEQVGGLLPDTLRIKEVKWLNATIFPFNRLFPRLSVWLSRRLLRAPILKRWMCGDFLVVLAPQ
jgi:SAM-dependent methyltransferase